MQNNILIVNLSTLNLRINQVLSVWHHTSRGHFNDGITILYWYIILQESSTHIQNGIHYERNYLSGYSLSGYYMLYVVRRIIYIIFEFHLLIQNHEWKGKNMTLAVKYEYTSFCSWSYHEDCRIQSNLS